MVKARKHRRVIALSNVDLALKHNKSDAEIVADNLGANVNKNCETVQQNNIVRKNKKNQKDNKYLSEHEKFLLEQCPPHFGKL